MLKTYTARQNQRTVELIERWTDRRVKEPLAGLYRSAFRGTSGAGPRPLMLLVDLAASSEFGSTHDKRELAAEVASVLAIAAEHGGQPTGLLVFTDRMELYLPPGRGSNHRRRILREILFCETKGDRTDVAAALEAAQRVVPGDAVVFVLSDFCLPGVLEIACRELESKLALANRRYDLVAASVNDPAEFDLPDLGTLSLDDGAGRRIEFDTNRDTFRKLFRQEAVRRKEALHRAIGSSGVDHLALTTDRPYLPVLMSFLAKRNSRRTA